MPTIKRALFSTYDKNGIADLAQCLASAGVELIASGGTATHLRQANLAITPLEDISGNPEAFSGRVKTLSFAIAASLLFRRHSPADVSEAERLGIAPIDLVVCNFYPFKEAMERGAEWEELIEFIDIGGPTLLRAAAKNHRAVTVLCHSGQYADFQKLFTESGGSTEEGARRAWAIEAFQYSADYEESIAFHLAERSSDSSEDSPQGWMPLRYGENPHQRAWVVPQSDAATLANIVPLQGKALSYNNFLDADAAWRCVSDLGLVARANGGPHTHAAVVAKHCNPCGAALASSPVDALESAWAGDPMSAFGSIVALNCAVDEAAATWICERFVEVVLAPNFSPGARELLKAKKNLRLLPLKPCDNSSAIFLSRSIDGGQLVQEEDAGFEEELRWVARQTAADTPEVLFRFGLAAVKHLRSNAIALVAQTERGIQMVGAGMGNPNRLASLEQAAAKARQNGWDDLSATVLISDAFFPFQDSIELAHQYGIKTIVQPGGGRRESEVIECCDKLGIAMALTGRRHFRH